MNGSKHWISYPVFFIIHVRKRFVIIPQLNDNVSDLRTESGEISSTCQLGFLRVTDFL